MTTDLKDVLMELDSKIAEVYDLDLAEEMTDIYIDLTDRLDEFSSQYWKLVKALAKTEKERDDLVMELKVKSKECKMVFEIGMDTVQEATSYPGSLPTPGAAEKTLAGAGHVNTNIFGGKLKIT